MVAEAGVARVWAFDEGRFGLRVWLRRRWCPYGVRPPWLVDDRYEWVWLYAAVEPATGASFFLLLPGVNKAWFACFLAAFAEETGGARVGLVRDGAPSHRAAIPWPEGLVPLSLPPYSPELNPAEQIFRVLRARLSNRIFEDLAELEVALTEQLQTFWDRPATLQQLTNYPWWSAAVATMTLSP
jgi:transposase